MVRIRSEVIRNYIDLKTKLAEKKGIEVILSDSVAVVSYNDDSPCNGYFDEDESKMVVAVGKPLMRWFRVFVHEACHMHQWIEGTKIWNNSYLKGEDSTEMLFEWVDGKRRFDEKTLVECIRRTRDLELDCEKRVIREIKKYDLPLDSVDCTQRSNAYVYFYNTLLFTKKWYTVGKEPYNVKRVWREFPGKFQKDYDNLPLEYYLLYKKYCF